MAGSLDAYDLSGAVDYHYGRFPPAGLDLAQLIEPGPGAGRHLAL